MERAVIYERVVEHVARFTPSYNLCSYYLRGKNLSLCRSLNIYIDTRIARTKHAVAYNATPVFEKKSRILILELIRENI